MSCLRCTLNFYPIFRSGSAIFWNEPIHMMFVCCYYQIQSDSGDSGGWNVVSISVPRCSSSNSLNLSSYEMGELCSEGGVRGPVPPLPGFPLLLTPLPRSGCLGNVAAGNLCPQEGMLWCINVDFSVDQSSRVDDR